MRFLARKWLVLAAAVLVLAVVLLIGLAYSPFARTRLVDWAFGTLETRFEIVARAQRAEIDPVRLRARLLGLELAAAGRANEPFLTIDELTVDAGWSSLWNQITIEVAEIIRPRLSLRRDDSAGWNLPGRRESVADEAPSEPSPLPLIIERLDLRELDVHIIDPTAGLEVVASNVGLQLSGGRRATGPLRLNGPATVEWRDRRTSISKLGATIAFDGLNLDIEDFAIAAPEGQVRIDGRIASIVGRPALELSHQGDVDLARVLPWMGMDLPLAGTVALSGRATGPARAPEVSADVSGAGLRWQDRLAFDLRATATVTSASVRLPSFAARLAGGEVTGRGEIAFNEEAVSQASVAWTNLDADTLAALLPSPLPARLGASMSGTSNLEWAELSPQAIRLSVENTTRGPGRDAGRISLTATGGVWRIGVDERLPSARVAGTVVADATTVASLVDADLGGELIVDVSDVAAFLRVFTAEWSRDVAGQIDGVVHADARLGGTLSAPEAAGSARSSRLVYRDLDPAELETQFTADRQHLALDGLTARLRATEIDGDLRLGFDDDTLGGRFSAKLADLAEVGARFPETVAPAGSAVIDGSVSGSLSAPRIDAAFAARPIRFADTAFDQVTATLAFRDGVLHLDTLEAVQGEGSLEASGRLTLEGWRYEIAVRGRALQLAALRHAQDDGEPGRATALRPAQQGDEQRGTDAPTGGDEGLTAREVSIDFEGAGTFDAPGGAGRVAASNVAWSGIDVGPIAATVAVANRTITLDGLMPDFETAVAGAIRLSEASTFEVEGRTTNVDLATVAQRLLRPGLPVSGAATSRVRASGLVGDPTMADLQLDVERLDALLGSSPVVLPRPARIEYAAGELRASEVELRLADTSVRIGGTIGRLTPGAVDVRLEGDLSDLDDLVRLAASEGGALEGIEMAGPIAVDASMSGTLENPVAAGSATLTDATLIVRGRPPLSAISAQLGLRDGILDLARFDASWQEAQISAGGRMPLATLGDRIPERLRAALPAGSDLATLTATFDGALAPLIAALTGGPAGGEIEGIIRGVVDLEADTLELDRVRGDLTLSQLTFSLAGVPVNQTVPTHLALRDGRLGVVAWNWGSGANELTVGGGLELTGNRPIDLTVTGEGDLRVLSVLVPQVATAGRAFLIANVQGTLDAPQLAGAVELIDGELRLSEPRLVVGDLTGALLLQRDRVTVHEMAGSANGGAIQLGGELTLDGFEPAGTITLAGRGIAMAYPQGLRSELQVDLALQVAGPELSLTGAATMVRGDYRESITLAGGLLAALQQAQAEAVFDEGVASPIDNMRLDVRLVTLDDVVVNNNYANGMVGATLRLGGTVGQPVVAGRATLRPGGRVFIGTNTYEIESGTIDFTDPTRIVPQLNLTARTHISSWDITLNLSGTPDNFTADFQSDPTLPEPDIISVLVTGRPLSDVAGAAGAVARDQALGFVSGELLGTASRSLGLDSVRIGRETDTSDIRFDSSLVAGETNPATRLTVGKNLSREVALVVSQNLRESGLFTWIVEYLPRDNVEVRAVVDDEHDRSYEFRHALSFGGRAPRSTSEAAPRPEPPRVGAIRFSGDPGFEPAALMDSLRLSPGDRFDFLRWQEDRDRLEALYHARGYYEARLRARRTEAGQAVILDYEISRGPRTVLTVEGHTLPAGLLDEMRREWSRAVFDGFLLEALSRIVRSHLTGDGFLRAIIDAEVQPASDEARKEILIRIEPGPRSSRRALAIDGASGIDEDTVRSFIRVQDLETTAWTEPVAIEDEVARFYRRRGFLGASATVGEPVFEGDRATLPVTIDEGPLFTIAEVTVDGVRALPDSEARRVLDLQPGGPYTSDAVEAARLRLDVTYRQDGFNQVRVTVRATGDRDKATVTVGVSVEEGPKQILRDVVFEGAAHTREPLVRRALDLDLGEPVNLGEWNRARKRLYDVGVFRTVDVQVEPIKPTDVEPGGAAIEPVRARVVLDEWPSYRLRYGMQVKDEAAPIAEQAQRDFRIGLVGDLTRQNLLGRAVSVGTSFRYDTVQQAVRGFLTTPSFFGLPISSHVFASRRQNKVPGTLYDSTENLKRLTLEQRLRPVPTLTIAYSYNFDRNTITSSLFDFPFVTDVARLDASAVVDRRDDIFNARRGWFHSSTFEYGPKVLGSDLRFVKYLTQQYYFRPVAERVVLASAARFGLARGLGGQQLIGTGERFFAGGGNSVRGYPDDGLGELNFLGEPVGGDVLLVLNQEIRFPLYKMFGGVGFVDAGNVFDDPGDLALGALKVGAGVGVRADTPFGLIRVDFGMPLSPGPDDPLGRWFFSIGQTF